MRFLKKPKLNNELLQGLIHRNLDVGDIDDAIRLLESVNYSRLASYWHDYRNSDSNGSFMFNSGTSLETIVRHYEFDRELRLIVFGAIERFEVQLRVAIASTLSTEYDDPFIHLNPTIMKDRSRWAATIARVHKEYASSTEDLARHHKAVYPEYFLPPIWVSVEMATFGGLRHLYQNLSRRADRQRISIRFGMNEGVFESWLAHIETVRNVCAHHARLWNRKFATKPKLPAKIYFGSQMEFNSEPSALSTIYNTILILDYVNRSQQSDRSLKSRVLRLIDDYSIIEASKMGFPEA